MTATRVRPSGDAWPLAILLLERWLERGERIDALLDTVRQGGAAARAGDRSFEGPKGRARCQHLLYGAVRHLGRLDAAIDVLVRRQPRARLRAVLLLAGFELLETETAPDVEGQRARIVHHAVDQAKGLLSAAEARMVNAVVRRLADGLPEAEPDADAPASELARYFSHPEWLVQRWRDNFGAPAALSLLRWDQTPPPVYARWRGPAEPPAWLQAVSWPGFHVVPAGHWNEIDPLLRAGALYLQDPSTALAPALLDPGPDEVVLDLCAAPGGKSLLLADLAARGASAAGAVGMSTAAGRVVSVDLPGTRRIGRLEANLARVAGPGSALVQADVLELTGAVLREHGLPEAYPAVLLDVPCTNTGVIRHRIDVKWRLHAGDVAGAAARQHALLNSAARLVAPGGRLVYSTCSLEPEENEGVVEAFLGANEGGFTLAATRHSRPWESGCDGAGVFLLRRGG